MNLSVGRSGADGTGASNPKRHQAIIVRPFSVIAMRRGLRISVLAHRFDAAARAGVMVCGFGGVRYVTELRWPLGIGCLHADRDAEPPGGTGVEPLSTLRP